MTFSFVATNRHRWPIAKMCRALGVTRQGFYASQHRETSTRERVDAVLRGRIHNVFFGSKKSYGSPRIHRALRDEGLRCSRKRVARLMSESGLRASVRRSYRVTTQSNHRRPVFANLVNRNFDVDLPNTVWVSDITYVKTRTGFSYLACVQDLFSRKIVGWSLSRSLHTDLVCDALKNAVVKRQPDAGLVVHSDRGVQYASAQYRELLNDFGFEGSMSRKGDCWDNATMESFFRSLKVERIYRTKLNNMEDAQREISDYIDIFYNRERMHSTLGYTSPVEYEKIMQRAV